MVGFSNGTIDMNDPNRTIFLIPEGHMPRLEREVAKLSKKAEKFNGWTFDILPIGFQFRENRDGTKTRLIEVCLDVEPIKIDGWRFLARIDHAPETGNILRAVPNTGVDIDARFRNASPDCQHCNHKRLRRDTFVLHNEETGEYKQVGSTCLADFLGHDAAKLGRIAELTGYACELARAIEREPAEEPRTLQERRYIDLWEFLVHTAAMVRLNGWTSGKSAYENGYTATRMQALDNMFPAPMMRMQTERPTAEDIELAKKALDWAQSFGEKADLNDYEHNVLVIAESSVIDYRSTGIAASIVGVYFIKNTPKRGAVNLGDMKPMLALFKGAGSRLKHPKINLNVGGQAIVLTVAGDRAKAPGTINVKSPGNFDNSDWYGRIELDGSYKPSRIAPKGIEQHLLAFAADPAKVAADHGHKTGQCCFCNRPLDDERSTEVGYGPVCADKWSLPWGAKKAVAA
ncbi:MAG: hypothetical protein DI537_41265 [Stutzerimonas stutzeri]|nr:MAG: hypothetical protein DI537_41265 [Stutzerimonas stutzeri]